MRPSIGVLPALALLVAAQLLLQGLLFAATALRMAVAGEGRFEAAAFVAGEPLLLGVAQLLALLPVVWMAVRAARGPGADPRTSLALAPVPARAAVWALVAGFALQFPLVELANVVSELVPDLARDPARDAAIREATRIDGPYRALAVPFAVVLVAPLTEELLFRGVLLPAMAERYGARVAWPLVAVLFGLFHLEPLAVLYASLAGLVLGAIALRARSVLPGIAFHAGFNAAPIVLPDTVVSIPGFNDAGPAGHLPAPLLVGSALLAALAAVLLARALDEPPPE